jgi:hypothetical protein
MVYVTNLAYRFGVPCKVQLSFLVLFPGLLSRSIVEQYKHLVEVL